MKFLFTIFLIILSFPLKSQHLIGLSKDEIENEMKSHYPYFMLDDKSINMVYKYLKYLNTVRDETLLVFLSDSNICSSTKLISDYSNLDLVKSDMKKFKPVGRDQWVYSKDGKEYIIKMKREEWFFSLFTCKKQ